MTSRMRILDIKWKQKKDILQYSEVRLAREKLCFSDKNIMLDSFLILKFFILAFLNLFIYDISG